MASACWLWVAFFRLEVSPRTSSVGERSCGQVTCVISGFSAPGRNSSFPFRMHLVYGFAEPPDPMIQLRLEKVTKCLSSHGYLWRRPGSPRGWGQVAAVPPGAEPGGWLGPGLLLDTPYRGC